MKLQIKSLQYEMQKEQEVRLHMRKSTQFFSDSQKVLACAESRRELRKKYKKSERELLETAKTGDENALARVMRKHGAYEYALLFQKTPEFKRRSKCK